MDQLSSCYFCGAALDASLSEYPVVPKSLHPDESAQQTVVLCPTCRRKLATIVESVVDAAEPVGSTSESTVDEDDQSELMDESGLDPHPDPMAVGDANESDDGDLLGDETADSTPEDGNSADEAEEWTAKSADESAPETADTASGGSSDTDTGNDEPTEPSLTRLEYSKVMRLLENRDFPVEREGFREVATSAYDIEPEQFDKIVDAAIDRGLIDEENGQFVSAE